MGDFIPKDLEWIMGLRTSIVKDLPLILIIYLIVWSDILRLEVQQNICTTELNLNITPKLL